MTKFAVLCVSLLLAFPCVALAETHEGHAAAVKQASPTPSPTPEKKVEVQQAQPAKHAESSYKGC